MFAGFLRHKHTTLVALISMILIGVTLPEESLRYFVEFALVASILYFALQSLGFFVRKSIFSSDLDFVDFPLGLAVVSLVASLSFKFSTSIVIPCSIVIAATLFKLYLLILKKGSSAGKFCGFEQSSCALLLVCLLLILSWYTPGNGLLHFPLDFDSGMLHVALPKKWLFLDEVGPQIYIRGPFVGNFAHTLYFIFLKIFNSSDSFLKVFNFCSLVSVFLTCKALGDKIPSLGRWPLVIPCLLVFYPDTREYLISTNLDALFLLYLFSGTVLILVAMNTLKYSDLFFGTALLGFSAGLKHFGFMMSAPLLVISYLFIFLPKNRINFKTFGLLSLYSLMGALCFLAVSLPFYLHNLLAKNNILFPFFGSKENTYGWTLKEISDFGSIIEVWGHRKDFFGFFSLVTDIATYPEKYQLIQLNTGMEFVYPSLFALGFVSFVLAVFLWFRGNKVGLLFALVNLLQLFFWYKGSQVVRYLLPNLAIGWLVFFYVLAGIIPKFKSIHVSRAVTGVLLVISLVFLGKSQAKDIKVPISAENKKETIVARYGDMYRAMEFLRNSASNGRIFYTGDVSFTQFMVDLDTCGDWFGICRWEDFYDININYDFPKFKSIEKTKNFLIQQNIKWVVVTWSSFYPKQRRPSVMTEAIPDTQCFIKEKEFPTVDIFKVNEDCLK